MDHSLNYLEVNKALWNERTKHHLSSAFYDMDGFMKGATSLKEIELGLLGNISGKKILHLQCHFGQDSLSLVCLGARVTGIDLSDAAIETAQSVAAQAGLDAKFICCDIYDLRQYLDEKFDMIFTTYGTIGWLPDLDKWAAVISDYLIPGGELVFAEFHPVVWMFDNDMSYIQYSYFNREAIIEEEQGTYADTAAPISLKSVGWNHSLDEVIMALLNQGLKLTAFHEYDFSPYNVLSNMVETTPGRFQLAGREGKLPLVYSLKVVK
jgi:2-polyprenyl-3-methyl-5-hydroxy-6-metoxy-1,4-benzoquinol methylase